MGTSALRATIKMGPAAGFVAVTPHNSTNIVGDVVALYVGTTGNVAAVTIGGAAVTFVGVPAGAILPIQAIRVNSTNTTASNIVALLGS